MKVRAKLHCSAVHATNHGSTPDMDWITITFTPVMGSIEGTENHKYWKASPSGKLEIKGYRKDIPHLFNPGDYIYLDTELLDGEETCWGVEDRIFILDERGESRSYSQLKIVLVSAHPAFGTIRLELSIDNKEVWEQYKELGSIYSYEIIPTQK